MPSDNVAPARLLANGIMHWPIGSQSSKVQCSRNPQQKDLIFFPKQTPPSAACIRVMDRDTRISVSASRRTTQAHAEAVPATVRVRHWL